MAKQRLSVAMCTYNGARFLGEQLDSIAAQTRRPDELVICDDCSPDSTVEVIEAFRSKAAFPVFLTINKKKLGSTKNFENAIGLCTGDIIALSDQDDVWQPKKLMLIEAEFLKSPGAGLVFTDAEVVDESLRPIGYRLWQSKGFNQVEQEKIYKGKAVQVLLKHNVVTGAAMAFRAEFRELFMPIPPNWVHDGWIALIIAACADLAMIHEPLIQYRQHLNQQIGAAKKGFIKQLAMAHRTEPNTYFNQLNRYEVARDRLLANIIAVHNHKYISQLEAKMDHLTVRGNMSRGKLRRLFLVLKELISFRYHYFSCGWKSAAKDILFN